MKPLAEVEDALRSAWDRSDRIFDCLADDALHARPLALRHPFVFYLGHLPAFGWNQVCRGVLGSRSPSPELDDLFERGIDPETAPSGDAPSRWPEADEIVAYRDRVRAALLDAVDEVAARDDPLCRHGRILHIVLEHELMHHETLLYMLQRLPEHEKREPPATDEAPRREGPAATDGGTIEIPAGRAVLGVGFHEIPFGWDNEFGHAEVEVPAFRIDALPVTNAGFLAFVEAGGYHDPRWWTPQGWTWRTSGDVEHPLQWSRDAGAWRVRGAFTSEPLEDVADHPAWVSWAEARACLAWRGQRLPTEAEFVRAAYGTPDDGVRAHPWGEAPPGAEHGSFGFHRWGPDPVGTHPAGRSAFGVHELVGNGWEWTSTVFGPLPGFEPWMTTYPGYSTDFFGGGHYVMRGGSWATDARLLRRSFRNWFRPHANWVFAKFRGVSDG